MAFSAKSSRFEKENILLARASAFPGYQSLSLLTAEKLRELATREGVDFATALLYDRVKRSAQYSPFIAQIDQLQSGAREVGANRDVTVAIVPAAFYKQNPDSGADGRLIREEAIRRRLRCELIPLASTGTLAENSQTILEWLAKHRGVKILLISLCKGGADVKFALGSPKGQEHFGDVLAWVNICGTLNGSPVAELLLATKTRFFLAWLYCKCRGAQSHFFTRNRACITRTAVNRARTSGIHATDQFGRVSLATTFDQPLHASMSSVRFAARPDRRRCVAG